MNNRNRLLLFIGCAVGIMSLMPDVTGAMGSRPPGVEEEDRCKRSRYIETLPVEGRWFQTVTPSEAYDSERTHVFPCTCTLKEMDVREYKVRTRHATGLSGPYNVVTRMRDEVFVLDGMISSDYCSDQDEGAGNCASGARVTKFNSDTLEMEWQTLLYQTRDSGDWDYPGVIGVHANGFLYVVSGYRATKLDPVTGDILVQTELPNRGDVPGRIKGDTTYNGFMVLSDGNLVAKSMDRKAGCTYDSVLALQQCYAEDIPSSIVVLEPDNLNILSVTELSEPSQGRISTSIFNGREYVYLVGFENIFRFEYQPGTASLALDPGWGPVSYNRETGQLPATATAVMGEYVVVQSNFMLSVEPLTITVVSQIDDTRKFQIKPFAGHDIIDLNILPESWQCSKPTVDPDNNRIYSYDYWVGELVAIDVTGMGLTIAWRKKHRSTSFGALIGPPEDRVFVLPDAGLLFEEMVWRDGKTGAELLRGPLMITGTGSPIAPGFDGRFYQVSISGELTELYPY